MRGSGAGRSESRAEPREGAERDRRAGPGGPTRSGRWRPIGLTELARIFLLAAIAAGLLFSFGVLLERGWQQAALTAAATSALLAASLPLLLRRTSTLYDPIWLVALTVGIGVTGKAFYVLFGPRERVGFLLLDKRPEDLLFAALVTAGGMLCFSIGYLAPTVRWRIPGKKLLTAEAWNLRHLAGVVGLLVVIGLLSFVAFALQFEGSFDELSDISEKRFVRVEGSGYRGVHGYLRWGASQMEIAFYLVFAWWAAKRRGLWTPSGLAVAALALAAVAFPFFASSRLVILLLVLRAFIVWLCIRGEPRLRNVAVAAVVVLALIGSMLALRRNLVGFEAFGEQLRPAAVLEITVGGRHFLDLTKTAHVLDSVPRDFDYQYGKTMVSWLLAPIPRALWPEKPPIGAGQDLGPAIFDSRKGTGVPPGIVAELYLNFGLGGILFGLFFAGFLLRSLVATLLPFFPGKSAVLIFAVTSSQLALSVTSHSVSGAAIKLVQELIPLVLALYACAWAAKRTAATPSPRLSPGRSAAAGP